MRRRAFTLFQLLVLLAALALLLALLLPAIARVRQAAARSASANNLKQIGLGLHNYHDVNGALPPGVDANGFSAAAHILPYLEQDALWKTIDFAKPVEAKANAEARKAVVKVFLSPFDPVRSVSDDYGATNYLFCAGSKYDLKDNDGVLYGDSKIQFVQVLDGTSNTMMAGETLKGDSGMKALDMRRQHVAYKADALAQLKEGAGADDWKADKHIAADRGASWMDGRFLQGTFAATYAVNDRRPDVTCGGAGGLCGLRSTLPGANVLICDGSVRFLADNVKPSVWKALATRAGNEVVPGF
jgi:type II secretory pathway pseudopilin PulG